MASDGWAVFETTQPDVAPIMFADGIAFEARSAMRVLGRQRGARYLQVVTRVLDTGVDVDERADGEHLLGQAIRGTTGAAHAVAVWIGTGEVPARPAVDSWDVNLEKGTSAAGGELDAVWDDGRTENTEYAWQGFLQVAHPDDVLTMTRLVTQFVDAEPGLLAGLQWSVKRGDGWAKLQSYGRYIIDEAGDRLWRGHSIDLTDSDETHQVPRSLFGGLLSGAGQQVALLDLMGPGPFEGPHIIRWMHQGLPQIDWPEDGWLGALVHPGDSLAARFHAADLEQLSSEDESVQARFRLRGTNVDWVEVELMAHLVDDLTAETAIAIARFTLAGPNG